jgi:N-acetylglucosaminyldiphosphoundecaprenol N-acetyl-beta-D-mannosaminyltransferase
VHGVMTAREDPELRKSLNQADIATPDGMPVVWAMRSFGRKEQQRVYGPTLMLKLCERAGKERHKVYLYGSSEEVITRLRQTMLRKFPGIQLVGAYAPPFRPLTGEEEEHIRQCIREADPDLLFVGISTPKQEKWMTRQQQALSGVVMVGVGAAFDFHAGRVKQAPKWMQDRGLEWLFRLMSEPKRLWRRYVLVTPMFLPHWAMQFSGLAKYEDSNEVIG